MKLGLNSGDKVITNCAEFMTGLHRSRCALARQKFREFQAGLSLLHARSRRPPSADTADTWRYAGAIVNWRDLRYLRAVAVRPCPCGPNALTVCTLSTREFPHLAIFVAHRTTLLDPPQMLLSDCLLVREQNLNAAGMGSVPLRQPAQTTNRSLLRNQNSVPIFAHDRSG